MCCLGGQLMFPFISFPSSKQKCSVSSIFFLKLIFEMPLVCYIRRPFKLPLENHHCLAMWLITHRYEEPEPFLRAEPRTAAKPAGHRGSCSAFSHTQGFI